jgi:hypothetical protein
MDAGEIVLLQHARLHSAAVGQPRDGSLADRFMSGMTDEQMRMRPAPHMNSVVWLLWHMARAEDVFINIVIRQGIQILDDQWMKRLRIARRDIGTGMTESEVADLSEHIDLAAVAEYRSAVGKSVRQFVAEMRPDDWTGDVEASDIQRAVIQGAFGPNAGWLETTFKDRSRAGVLSALTIIHNAEHLGEAVTVRSLAGLGLPM